MCLGPKTFTVHKFSETHFVDISMKESLEKLFKLRKQKTHLYPIDIQQALMIVHNCSDYFENPQ